MGEYFRKHIPTTLKLFDARVTPILIYMADFWGCLKMPNNNPIEIFENKFLKDILGANNECWSSFRNWENSNIDIRKKGLCKKQESYCKEKCNSFISECGKK